MFCGTFAILFMLIGLSTCGIVRYRLRALWYPNVTHSPPPSPDCPQLVPGDRKVDTHFHSNFTLPGAALRLAAGHYADVTSPDLDSSEVLSWVMQLRGGGSGDVMEFTMRSGGTLEVRLEHKKNKIHLSYRNGNATWYESFRYEPDPDAVWQTVAVGFDPSEGDVFVWTGGVSLGKMFEKEGSLTFARPFFPNRVRLGSSDEDNSPMEIACLMLFSYDDWRDVKQSEMDELLAQCSHNQTASVLGCIMDKTATTTAATTEPTKAMVDTTTTEMTTTTAMVDERTTLAGKTTKLTTATPDETTTKTATMIKPTAAVMDETTTKTETTTVVEATTWAGKTTAMTDETTTATATTPKPTTATLMMNETMTGATAEKTTETTISDELPTPAAPPSSFPPLTSLPNKTAWTLAESSTGNISPSYDTTTLVADDASGKAQATAVAGSGDVPGAATSSQQTPPLPSVADPDVGTSLPVCGCECLASSGDNATLGDANKYAESLLMNRSALSSTRRRKESAEDHRPSAHYMGYAGISLLTFAGSLIVCADLSSLLGARLCASCHRHSSV